MNKLQTIIVVFFVVFALAATQQSVVVISKDMQQPVLDTQDLVAHLNSNQELRAFIVDTAADQQSELAEVAKEVLEAADVAVEDVSSFLAEHKALKKQLGDLADRFESVTPAELKEALSNGNAESVVHFSRRRLQETQDQKSLLFINMTPAVLSGLLVALFLIIVLLIGINCLYNIKTNDKFARSTLWVGKQS